MWKFVLVLLISALATLIAQLVSDAPVIQHASACQCRHRRVSGIRG